MSEPVRKSYSKSYLQAYALRWMQTEYGPVPKDGEERDKWYTTLGMLHVFVTQLIDSTEVDNERW